MERSDLTPNFVPTKIDENGIKNMFDFYNSITGRMIEYRISFEGGGRIEDEELSTSDLIYLESLQEYKKGKIKQATDYAIMNYACFDYRDAYYHHATSVLLRSPSIMGVFSVDDRRI